MRHTPGLVSSPLCRYKLEVERDGRGVGLPPCVVMTQRTRLLIPAALAAATIAIGCGDEAAELNDRIDQTQQQVQDAQRKVDQAREALEDPAGAATDEARRRLEDAERDLREAQQPE